MSFTPFSSFIPATVVVGGTVAVSNFPASQPVTGPLTDAQLAARLPLSVTGPLTDAQLAARLPLGVTGPLTDAQLAARLPLAISGAVTGPLTDAQLAARLPLSVSVGNFPADQLVHFVTPISVTQGTTPWVVDGSAVTQPISAASLPLPAGAATEATLDRVKRATNDLAGVAMLETDAP